MIKLDIIKQHITSKEDYGILREQAKQAGMPLYSLHKLIEKMRGEQASGNVNGFIGIGIGECAKCQAMKTIAKEKMAIAEELKEEKKTKKIGLLDILLF